MIGQLLRYCVVGGCGFAVEALIVALLQYGFGWSALPCRAVSFPIALLVTYRLNQRYTFGSEGGLGELSRYVATQGTGLAANLAAYLLTIVAVPALDRHALVALAIGSAAGLAVNFALAKLFVFKRR